MLPKHFALLTERVEIAGAGQRRRARIATA